MTELAYSTTNIAGSLSLRIKWLFVVLTFLLVAMAPLKGYSNALQYTKLKGPIYFEEGDNYFELIQIKAGYSIRGAKIAEIGWERSQKLALRLSHKGRRGRLAIIPDAQTTNFLKNSFKLPGNTWIGLRFWCRYRKLMWSNGKIHPLSGYKNWTNPWSSDTTCRGKKTYAVVYLTESHQWRAHGQLKEQRYILVEYPAPAKSAPQAGE